jgi:hypothetical protein
VVRICTGLANHGLIQRMAKGVYRLTDAGYNALGEEV